ncbi:hypothetical protein MJT46_008292, partial [Ovis ammon polii x Ovis aries]
LYYLYLSIVSRRVSEKCEPHDCSDVQPERTGAAGNSFFDQSDYHSFLRAASVVITQVCLASTSVLEFKLLYTPIAWTPFFPRFSLSNIVTLSQLFPKAVVPITQYRVEHSVTRCPGRCAVSVIRSRPLSLPKLRHPACTKILPLTIQIIQQVLMHAFSQDSLNAPWSKVKTRKSNFGKLTQERGKATFEKLLPCDFKPTFKV